LQDSEKLLQTLGIPFAALVSVIFGLMIVSFPIGAYLVYNSELGDRIASDFPLNELNFFLAGIENILPIGLELGDAFIVIWSLFIILFSIALFGPNKNFLKTLLPVMTDIRRQMESNYMVSMITWFTILVVVSSVINFVQENLGILIQPPEYENQLVQFFYVSLAPLTEELVFRVLLIGIPLFAIYSHKASIRLFFSSVWKPQNLHIYESKKAFVLIATVGVIFGLAHIISGEPWSLGKFSQAVASGIIIGWVYFRYGLVASILIHWATNYFIFSYIFLITGINDISTENAFTHSLISTLEVLIVMTGIFAIALITINYLNVKKKENLKI